MNSRKLSLDEMVRRVIKTARFEHDCQGGTVCGVCEDIRELEAALAQQAQPEHHADCTGKHACIVKWGHRTITLPEDDQ